MQANDTTLANPPIHKHKPGGRGWGYDRINYYHICLRHYRLFIPDINHIGHESLNTGLWLRRGIHRKKRRGREKGGNGRGGEGEGEGGDDGRGRRLDGRRRKEAREVVSVSAKRSRHEPLLGRTRSKHGFLNVTRLPVARKGLLPMKKRKEKSTRLRIGFISLDKERADREKFCP